MKKVLLFAIMLFSFSSMRAQWAEQFIPWPFIAYTMDMEAVDANTAWAIPWHVIGTARYYGRVYAYTTDGGATWAVDSIKTIGTTFVISNVWPVNDSTCYLCINNQSATGGHGGIYKTTNNGTNWTQVGTNMFVSATSFPNFVYFKDAKNGLAMGDPIGSPLKYEVYTTTDSGTTWTRVPPANFPALTNAAEFGITNLFTTVGDNIWFATTYGDLYHSPDFGTTWTKSTIGFPPLVVTTNRQDIDDIAFTDGMHGIVTQVDTSAILHIKQTSDGGQTWTAITPLGPIHTTDFDAIPGVGVLITAGSNQAFGFGVSASYDLGLNWVELDNMANSHTALDFVDGTTGWTGRYVALPNTTSGAWSYIGNPFLVAVNEYAKTKETQVFPNPSSGTVHVLAASHSGKTTFNVYDLQGKNVFSETAETLPMYNHELNLNGLASGVYMLSITDGQSVSQHKLIIQ